MLRNPAPAEPLAYARQVLELAASGQARPLSAVAELAQSLGRGIAGLVDALDPDLMTLGGLALGLPDVVPEEMYHAYLAGLMA